jgi:uncharacterized protein YndB with AHSA1/START domain
MEETMITTVMAIIVAVLIVAMAAILVVAATKPDTFRIQRAATIKAPPEKIFPLINDLHRHLSWSPFEKDPAMKRSFNGAEIGKGQVYAWDGNRQVGAGRIEITEALPPSKVAMKLDMLRPLKASNDVEFTLVPNGDSTVVTWAMRGRQPYMAKLMSTLINCDKMVGGQFEQGLAKLKTVAES